jgi:hypothetical protein
MTDLLRFGFVLLFNDGFGDQAGEPPHDDGALLFIECLPHRCCPGGRWFFQQT